MPPPFGDMNARDSHPDRAAKSAARGSAAGASAMTFVLVA
jgi:hypothetical protein